MDVETIEYKGYKIEIVQDECGENPRDSSDPLGTIFYWHRQYRLGGKRDINATHAYPDSDPAEVVRGLADGGEVLPLYCRDQDCALQTRLGTRAAWPHVGYIYCPKDKIRAEYGDLSANSRTTARRVLEAEVAEMSAYLTGEVYGWRVVGPDGSTVDSCWGYYGLDLNREYMLQCGHEAVDAAIAAVVEQHTLCACVI